MTTRVASSPVFKRLDDGNLEVTVPITIPEALRGGTIEVPTLSGTKKIKVAPGTKHGTIQRLRGEGPPKRKGKGRGDIRYRLEIAVPEELSEEQQRGGREAGRGAQRRPTRAPSCCGRRGADGRPTARRVEGEARFDEERRASS